MWCRWEIESCHLQKLFGMGSLSLPLKFLIDDVTENLCVIFLFISIFPLNSLYKEQIFHVLLKLICIEINAEFNFFNI